jgi:hypothetical protein
VNQLEGEDDIGRFQQSFTLVNIRREYKDSKSTKRDAYPGLSVFLDPFLSKNIPKRIKKSLTCAYTNNMVYDMNTKIEITSFLR